MTKSYSLAITIAFLMLLGIQGTVRAEEGGLTLTTRYSEVDRGFGFDTCHLMLGCEFNHEDSLILQLLIDADGTEERFEGRRFLWSLLSRRPSFSTPVIAIGVNSRQRMT